MVVMAEFVPYSRRETYQLHDIPPAVLRNIGRRAERRNTSHADVVAQELAAWCGIPFVPSTRRRRRPIAGTSLSVRVPVEVMGCVRREADAHNVTFRSVILWALADAFGLKRPRSTHVEPGSRPGRRKET